ncbi:hypothetical protein ACFYUV_50215 [Nonomuraea sp. NPDC003560]|uniref:hypothetical protein n=1 Tax=Nonomuraea sp. NPDC003560 TaxID=3364341 RepID=UPI00369A061E
MPFLVAIQSPNRSIQHRIAAAGGSPPSSSRAPSDRQVVARDRIRRLTLLTGIVTVLRHENDLVEVPAATEAEAARVLMVEGMRS